MQLTKRAVHDGRVSQLISVFYPYDRTRGQRLTVRAGGATLTA